MLTNVEERKEVASQLRLMSRRLRAARRVYNRRFPGWQDLGNAYEARSLKAKLDYMRRRGDVHGGKWLIGKNYYGPLLEMICQGAAK